jgi:hypothetical protein
MLFRYSQGYLKKNQNPAFASVANFDFGVFRDSVISGQNIDVSVMSKKINLYDYRI